ncbi:TGS domain-containing protein [archaeon]|jgi:uncharacterized protein|nr:TGS domain-containing protein [archaeon]MBT4397040.1 TGS domain-containing protein [archaeon]MBT4441031.1 TGS domain-containing protein [archaeon]
MPINAKPEYFKAEKKYYEADTIAEKIKALEEMLSKSPSHKGAETLRAGIKTKLAKYRMLLEKDRQQQQKKKGARVILKREGAAQVILVSVTNAGKSSLLDQLTNANPKIEDYEYTTKKPEMGILEYKGVQIQIIEMPAIYEDFAYKGMGPTYFSLMRGVDLIVFLIDTTKDVQEQMDILNGEFDKVNIRLNKERPPVEIKKTGLGGIEFSGQNFLKFNAKKAKKMLKENNYHNAIVNLYGPTNIEQFADALNEAVTYLPLLIIYNKGDLSKNKDCISSLTGKGIEGVKDDIWSSLGLIKVYTKQPGKEKEYPPIALKRQSQVKDLALSVHKDFLKKFKFARLWGKSAKHQGQRVGIEHRLRDEDVVELHLK